eukprot:12055475-Alexandrium_andersonii.AAC.1
MSASLVGSEMCIRDSFPEIQLQRRTSNSARPKTCSPKGSARLSRRRNAVSYTHLTLPTICSV